ncbi:cyclin-dependent protein kinase [Syncephalis pseudoplumigaleata]|uniref:non-specific serine/threonine protein kinase n=1 Tax=Syncephalis pseudoplumigaleata TaxID=1712513 RepID=A0A4P9Z885_9FUNG|nr:cyclin-dependent protein kinase [Syncephalis pseudoplumigaleata]|eukprot:RKP27960.1 cyclin-dependent protein kinase [Syncephalis pseudoplumigaleata]
MNEDEQQQQEEEEEEEEEEESSDYQGYTYQGERADIAHINENFPLLAQQYRLLRKIGEGTFSVVFKAQDLLGRTLKENRWQLPPASLRYMAIKCIHVTSAPERIHSEISKLVALRRAPSVAPMLDAFRYEDRVAIVLPYIKHIDFRSFYPTCSLDDIRHYMYALLLSLRDTHKAGIVHRDVKPTNFLYDHHRRRGFLVDFGLAQVRRGGIHKPLYPPTPSTIVGTPRSESNQLGYLLRDSRPTVRADRAGTRGFRPPEVLLKVEHQTTALDIWAAGVIMLCLLTGRYPFFNSSSDAEALLEITCVHGQMAIKTMAAKYHRSFHCTIPSMRNHPTEFTRLIRLLNEDRPDFLDSKAIDLLEQLLKVDPAERVSAADALSHPFFV